MYCRKCGVEINENDVFCKSCGEKLKKDDVKAPFFDLKAKKTGWQAFLLYLVFIIAQVIFLSFLAMIAITVMQANGTYPGPVAFKQSTKHWGLLLNPLSCLIISLIIMKAKNIMKAKKAVTMVILGMIMSFLLSAVAGFIFPAIMTTFNAKNEENKA